MECFPISISSLMGVVAAATELRFSCEELHRFAGIFAKGPTNTGTLVMLAHSLGLGQCVFQH